MDERADGRLDTGLGPSSEWQIERASLSDETIVYAQPRELVPESNAPRPAATPAVVTRPVEAEKAQTRAGAKLVGGKLQTIALEPCVWWRWWIE